MTTLAEARAGTFEVPGARLHYEVRGDGPVLALVGSPMGAEAFRPLAERLAHGWTVVTVDPRGIQRSVVDDPDTDSTPDQRAEDLSRLLRHIDPGPVAVFGSSGGAVTALALAQAHPAQVHTVIAHEPPLTELLPDRELLRAGAEEYCAAYLAGDTVGAWRAFLFQAGIDLPDEVIAQVFGSERDAQTLADERFWFAHELRPTTTWRPDIQRLRASGVRVVVAIGEESAGQICDRTSRALAQGLDLAPTSFPGDHTGFVDDPAAAATAVRAVLRPTGHDA